MTLQRFTDYREHETMMWKIFIHQLSNVKSGVIELSHNEIDWQVLVTSLLKAQNNSINSNLNDTNDMIGNIHLKYLKLTPT